MRNWTLGLAGAVVIAVAAPAVAQANWTWVTDTTEGLTIELPGTAQRSAKPTETSAGALGTVSYSFGDDDGFYIAATTTVPEALDRDDVGKGLDESVTGAIAASDGKETWRRSITVSGQPAREAEYTTTAEGMRMQGRVLITYRNGRLYTIVAIESGDKPIGRSERMIRSFRLLD